MKFCLQCSTASQNTNSNGNCEEELPKKPVGRLSVNCRSTVGRQSADSRPTVGQLLANCRPTVGQQSADCRPTVGRLLPNCRPTVCVMFEAKVLADCVGRLSANSRPTVGDRPTVLADCRPTVGRQSVICWQPVGNVSVTCRRDKLK